MRKPEQAQTKETEISFAERHEVARIAFENITEMKQLLDQNKQPGCKTIQDILNLMDEEDSSEYWDLFTEGRSNAIKLFKELYLPMDEPYREALLKAYGIKSQVMLNE